MSRCKECGGGSICEHKRRRSQCKRCQADKDDSMPPDLEVIGDVRFDSRQNRSSRHGHKLR